MIEKTGYIDTKHEGMIVRICINVSLGSMMLNMTIMEKD
jgi:hypothetical protein